MTLENKWGKDSKIVGTLEIYHISISLGDTAVIVTRDSNENIINSVLIDLGSNHEEVLCWCRKSKEINGFNDKKKATFDYVIVSHNHADHTAGIQYGNVVYDHLLYSYVSDNKIFKDVKRKHKSVTDKVTSKPKLGKVNSNNHINLFDHLKVTKTKDSLYTIPLAKNIELKCICANGIYLNEKGEKIMHEGNFNSWNDHSIAWLLEYKKYNEEKVSFRYFTAGDLSGDDKGNYTNIEEQLIPFFEGDKNKEKITVDLLKATHHGSKHSLSRKFLETIKPQEIIVPCNNSHLLPFPQFFERLRSLEANDKTFKPKIFIANYMHFKFADYLKKVIVEKGKPNKDEVFKAFGVTCPIIKKVKVKKTDFITTAVAEIVNKKKTKKRKRGEVTIDKNVKQANMKVFKTSMIRGEFETKALKEEIACEIKAPTHAPEKLPILLYNFYLIVDDYIKYDIAEEALYLAYQNTKKGAGKINKKDIKDKLLKQLYTINDGMYIERDNIDESLENVRTELVQAFRDIFGIKRSGGNNVTNREILNPSFLRSTINSNSKNSRVYNTSMERYKQDAKIYFKELNDEQIYSTILFKNSKGDLINPNKEKALKKRKYDVNYTKL